MWYTFWWIVRALLYFRVWYIFSNCPANMSGLPIFKSLFCSKSCDKIGEWHILAEVVGQMLRTFFSYQESTQHLCMIVTFKLNFLWTSSISLQFFLNGVMKFQGLWWNYEFDCQAIKIGWTDKKCIFKLLLGECSVGSASTTAFLINIVKQFYGPMQLSIIS